jgi:hypothetical protein
MLDEGTSTRNALAIADELARLGRVARHRQLDGLDDGVGAARSRRTSPRRWTSWPT